MILQHNLFHWCRSVSVISRQAGRWRFLLFLKPFKSATESSREEGVKAIKIIIMSVKGVEVPSNYFFVGISGTNADCGIFRGLGFATHLRHFSSSLSSRLSKSKVETRLPCLRRRGQDEICDSVQLHKWREESFTEIRSSAAPAFSCQTVFMTLRFQTKSARPCGVKAGARPAGADCQHCHRTSLCCSSMQESERSARVSGFAAPLVIFHGDWGCSSGHLSEASGLQTISTTMRFTVELCMRVSYRQLLLLQHNSWYSRPTERDIYITWVNLFELMLHCTTDPGSTLRWLQPSS